MSGGDVPARFPVRLRRLGVVLARDAALIWVGVLLVMGGCQSRYIYYPRTGPEADLAQEALGVRLSPWRDGEGRIIGWQNTDAGEPAVLLFHGNAGCALDRWVYVAELTGLAGHPFRRVCLFEYPGYGARPGAPSEATVTRAALAAFDELANGGKVFLVGESLGTGVACSLAAARPDRVAGLLLLTPFTSLRDVARAHYPWLPVNLFMRDRYDNTAALRAYRGPVVVVVAGQDTVVPPDLGLKLYESYTGPKRLRTDAGLTHNDLDISARAPWWRESWQFLFDPGM